MLYTITGIVIIFFLTKYWKDDRLRFSAGAVGRSGKGNNVGHIKHASLKDLLWTPDPFFVNQKEGKVLDNPADNTLFKLVSTGMEG